MIVLAVYTHIHAKKPFYEYFTPYPEIPFYVWPKPLEPLQEKEFSICSHTVYFLLLFNQIINKYLQGKLSVND